MSDAAIFPQPLEGDSEDVSWALSTGQAMWTRGDTSEAVRWVKRASESASDAGDDDRALALARSAADLKMITGGSVMPAAPPPEPKVETAPPPSARASTGAPSPAASSRPAPGALPATRSQSGASPRLPTGAPPPAARGSGPQPTAGRAPPTPTLRMPLPTAGARQSFAPAKRPAPPPPALPARPVPAAMGVHAREEPSLSVEAKVPRSQRDTAVPNVMEDADERDFERHEAPTFTGGEPAPPPPPPRATMPTPTEVYSTVVPREAFADPAELSVEEPSSADDGPTSAVFETVDPSEPTPRPATALPMIPARAPELASAAVWIVSLDGAFRVVAANGARPHGAFDAVLVASAADLASALAR